MNFNQIDSAFTDAFAMISKRIDENKVIELSKSLQSLEASEKGLILMNPKWMDFILPLTLKLLQSKKTDVNTAWHLLEIMTR